MKTLLSTSIFTILALTIGAAHADSGVYTSLKAGVSDMKYKNSTDTLDYDETTDLVRFNDDQSKSVYPTISAAIGYDFSKISNVNARAELEYTYKDSVTFQPNHAKSVWYENGQATSASDVNSASKYPSELKTQALMVNGYYDFRNKSKFTPYISAGVGVTRINNTQNYEMIAMDHYESDSDNHFTWSAGAGVSYAVSKNVDLDLSYRYVDAGKYEFVYPVRTSAGDREVTNVDIRSHEYLLGLRYTF